MTTGYETFNIFGHQLFINNIVGIRLYILICITLSIFGKVVTPFLPSIVYNQSYT